MTHDESWRRDVATKGAFVVAGLVYVVAGPPLFGLEARFVGSGLVAYGVVSFVGNRLIHRWGLLDR